ncbi:hypothetical protein D3C81_1591560 [compost metagenome]
MDLQQINVVGAQPLEAVVNGLHDFGARQSLLQITQGEIDFGGDHYLVTAGIIAQCLADDLLTAAV